MNWLMQLNHMLLIYFVAVTGSFLVLRAVLFVRLQHQIEASRRLAAKIDKMVADVLELGDTSDFRARNKTI